mgnify:CR=1 FL=1
MSLYSLANSAPLYNVGYNDSHIHYQQNNNNYRQINNHQFNHHVADSYNTNTNNNYEIYQSQTYPSSQ